MAGCSRRIPVRIARSHALPRCLSSVRRSFETFGATDIAAVTHGLGHAWDITTHLAIKLMPGAHPYHAAAEAAALAATQANITPDEVERISVAARALGRRLVYHPTDLVGMAHSLPYFVAAAVVDRRFGWEHATPAKILDPVIGRLQDTVQGDPDPEHSASV